MSVNSSVCILYNITITDNISYASTTISPEITTILSNNAISEKPINTLTAINCLLIDASLKSINYMFSKFKTKLKIQHDTYEETFTCTWKQINLQRSASCKYCFFFSNHNKMLYVSWGKTQWKNKFRKNFSEIPSENNDHNPKQLGSTSQSSNS